MRQRLLISQLVTLCALWVAQSLGIYLYARMENNAFFADSHFLGGMWTAFFFAWAFTIIGRKLPLAGFLASALAFGIAWELYEVVLHLVSPDSLSYAVDTVADLIFDALGGYCAALLARKFSV